jgi:threonine dehydrogenase-like Zn-dependent dehydrogenase
LGGRVKTGKGYDVVVDAVGSQAAFDDSIQRVRPGGTVLEVGGFWDPVQVGAAAMLKEVTITPAVYSGHHHGQSEFERAARMLEVTPDAAAILVTHRFPLDQAAEAFAVAGDKTSGALKVHLHP